MNKIIAILKKIWYFIKKDYLLLFGLIFIAGIITHGIMDKVIKEHKQAEKLSKVYVLEKSGSVLNLKGAKLDQVEKLVIVSPSLTSKLDIVVKNKGAKSVTIYKDIGRQQYSIYLEGVLLPYLATNPDFDIVFRGGYKGIGSVVGLEEPYILEKPNNESSQTVTGTLLGLMPLIIILIFLIILMNRGTTTKADEIYPDEIKDSLDDLIGLDDIKSELLQLEDMYINKALYSKYNVAKNFNVMMTGPAGVGKTKIARCLAKRLDIPLIYGSAAGLQSGYVGGGTRALKALVKKASKHKRAIIFLDEGESLFRNRMHGLRSYETETINSFLSILDGVNTSDNEIIWMVASNMDENKVDMDPAMLRRFHLKINFRLPNFETRKMVIDRLISKLDTDALAGDIDVTKLAGVSAGLSPALLETMVDRACLMAIKEGVKVSHDVVMRAFERVAVGLTDRDTTGAMDEVRKIVARHEVGHFMMKLHECTTKYGNNIKKIKANIDVIKISTESVSKHDALGFVLSRDKDAKLETLQDYESQIMQLYGGMACEEIYYGAAGVTAGAHNDIQKVSKLLRVMICEVGFYQNQKINYSVINKDERINEYQLKLIEDKSEHLYAETKRILQSYGVEIALLVDRLMSNYVLNIDDALALVVGECEDMSDVLV